MQLQECQYHQLSVLFNILKNHMCHYSIPNMLFRANNPTESKEPRKQVKKHIKENSPAKMGHGPLKPYRHTCISKAMSLKIVNSPFVKER